MTDHRVHVVTDSTASLPAGSDERLRAVPLHVIVDDESYLEGVGLTAEDVAAHLQAG
ncbi:DegV family protein, partial [Cellulosimicrobium funkei]